MERGSSPYPGTSSAARRASTPAIETKDAGKTCPSCGNFVPAEDWFCRECGTVVAPHGDLSAGAAPESPTNRYYVSEPRPSVAPKLLGGLAAVLVVAGVAWWARAGKLPIALPWSAPVEAGSAAGSASAGSGASGAVDPGAAGVPAGQGSNTGSDGVQGGGSDAPGQDPTGAAVTTDPAEATVTYELVQEALSWDEAQAWCEEHGGTLAQPHTFEQLAQIGALIKPSDVWVAWVGAQVSSDAGSGYEWLDGAPVAGELFDASEPNNETGSEVRLAILRTNDGYYLYDVDAELRSEYPANRLGFVMERVE